MSSSPHHHPPKKKEKKRWKKESSFSWQKWRCEVRVGVEAIITDYLHLLGLKAPPPSLCPTDYKQKKKKKQNETGVL